MPASALCIAVGTTALWWYWPVLRPVPDPLSIEISPVEPRLFFTEAAVAMNRETVVKQAAPLLAMTGFPTVADKSTPPPSGDPRDYQSLSIYWWPDPDKKDGLPWIHRDGEKNPAVGEFDPPKLRKATHSALTLAKAWKVTGEEAYAEKAARILRVFFLSETTGMNPNLNFAQGIPGHKPGNRQGVIEGLPISREALDAVTLVRDSPSWSVEDDRQFRAWVRDFRNWLVHSPLGKSESRRRNNHGVWYDVQVASLGIFLGELELVEKYLRKVSTRRLLMQIDPDGKQPRELRRTKSWDYSVYNLDALLCLIRLGQMVGVDLWNYPSREDRRIERALAFLESYRGRKGEWEWEQIEPFEPGEAVTRIRRHHRLPISDNR